MTVKCKIILQQGVPNLNLCVFEIFDSKSWALYLCTSRLQGRDNLLLPSTANNQLAMCLSWVIIAVHIIARVVLYRRASDSVLLDEERDSSAKFWSHPCHTHKVVRLLYEPIILGINTLKKQDAEESKAGSGQHCHHMVCAFCASNCTGKIWTRYLILAQISVKLISFHCVKKDTFKTFSGAVAGPGQSGAGTRKVPSKVFCAQYTLADFRIHLINFRGEFVAKKRNVLDLLAALNVCRGPSVRARDRHSGPHWDTTGSSKRWWLGGLCQAKRTPHLKSTSWLSWSCRRADGEVRSGRIGTIALRQGYLRQVGDFLQPDCASVLRRNQARCSGDSTKRRHQHRGFYHGTPPATADGYCHQVGEVPALFLDGQRQRPWPRVREIARRMAKRIQPENSDWHWGSGLWRGRCDHPKQSSQPGTHLFIL